MNHGRLLFALCAVGIGLVGCDATTPPHRIDLLPTPIVAATLTSTIIDSENVHNLTELSSYALGSSEPIAAIAFNHTIDEVVSATAPGGRIRRFDLKNGSILSGYELGQVKSGTVSFDGRGDLVAAVVEPSTAAVAAPLEFGGIHVLDTLSGNSVRLSDNRILNDVRLSQDGQLVLEIGIASYSVYATDTGKHLGGLDYIKYNPPKADGMPAQPIIGAIDPSGEWIAYANDAGLIQLEPWHDQTLAGWQVSTKSEVAPVALVFNPTRELIAAATTESLSVWNLQARLKRLVLEEPYAPSPMASVAFSPDGKLLALGTEHSWQIRSVDDWQILFEHAIGAYAVNFSPDGRLFAWGDTDGIVHVWGVPDFESSE